jgi:hypothetical protein
MTAYEVIQQHPEWVKNPTATRKAIEAAARRYVRELNNNALIVEDLDALLIARNALLNPTEEAKDFAQIAIVGNEIVDDGAKRMAKVYALFIKGIIAELNGKAICTAAQIQEWRERYGVKLEGLQGKSKKETKEFEPIGLDEERAIKIYNWARRSGRIECTEDAFIWYFGKKTDRTNDLHPAPIKWKGLQNELAYLCSKCADYTKDSNADDIKWKGVYDEIFALDDRELTRTRQTCNKMKNQTNAYPKCVQEIDALFT